MKKKTIKAKLAKTEKKLAKTKTKLSAAKSALKAVKKTKPVTARTTEKTTAKNAGTQKPAGKKPTAKKPVVKKAAARKRTFKKKSPFAKSVAISLEELLPETNGTPAVAETSEPPPQPPVEVEPHEPTDASDGEQSAAA